jgi:hypothetical protein
MKSQADIAQSTTVPILWVAVSEELAASTSAAT